MRKESGEKFPESREVSGHRRALSRRELWMKQRIIEDLRGGPKTVPEVAEGLGIPVHEAMWWLMGYVRYGYVSPTEDITEDGYYRYALVEGVR